MEQINLVVLILSMLLIGAISVFFILYKKREKNSLITEKVESSNKKVELNGVVSVGFCEISGTEEAFVISFDGDISFLVENGIITGFKTKKHPEYKKY